MIRAKMMLEKETDIVELLRMMRFVKRFLHSLSNLGREKLSTLKEQSRFETIELGERRFQGKAETLRVDMNSTVNVSHASHSHSHSHNRMMKEEASSASFDSERIDPPPIPLMHERSISYDPENNDRVGLELQNRRATSDAFID